MLCGLTLTSDAVGQSHGRGKQWVRSHPFTVMGLTALRKGIDTDLYRKGGFGSALAFKNKPAVFQALVDAGIPYHCRLQPPNKGPLTDDLRQITTETINTYPGCTGIFAWDEPKWIHMKDVAQGIQWIRKTFPGLLAYSNANPIGGDPIKYYGQEPPNGQYPYEQYIKDFATITTTDVLSFDVYPFRGESDTTIDYWPNLEIVRSVALEAGIPYWIIVQSFEANFPGGLVAWLPSESALRMQVFSSLAYGFTGISYFCYDNVFERGLLYEGGRPTYLYYDAARVNTEVSNLGPALRFLTSRDVLHIPGSHQENNTLIQHQLPPRARAYSPAAAARWSIRNISIQDQGPGKDALLGLFQDDHGQRYFMIVNLWHSRHAAAAQRRLNLTIHFDPSVKEIARLSRETGRPELLAVPGSALQLTLPGGTGDLFKLADAQFPGLNQN